MADLLKDMFNEKSLTEIAQAVQSVYEPFQVNEFLSTTLDETWNQLELKERGRKICLSMGKYLPQDFGVAIDILEKALTGFPIAFFVPDFIEVYGQDDINWDIAISALERNTVYWSSEFAVRPFIIKHEKKMMKQMYAWSKHENEHIRRLSSEGCRPQLPWGQSLVKYKKDPTPILPILEQLKADPSLYVRRSVANNINDISKTNPDLVIQLAKDWYGDNENTNWIVKHGCRTLLKKGNWDILSLFGYDDIDSVVVDDLKMESTSIAIGEEITFSFVISASKKTKVRLEYGIDYVKANGKRNRKIFQISQMTINENTKKEYSRKHSFENLSTRKHYPGTHTITLIVNGVSRWTQDFELTN